MKRCELGDAVDLRRQPTAHQQQLMGIRRHGNGQPRATQVRTANGSAEVVGRV